jgi:hypothetical protein
METFVNLLILCIETNEWLLMIDDDLKLEVFCIIWCDVADFGGAAARASVSLLQASFGYVC